MKKLSSDIIHFFQNQGFVVVTTIDQAGFPHASCKGIVKIEPGGSVYLLDLYRAKTFENLKHNPYMSITAVNEHKFSGYCLKGKAQVLPDTHHLRDELLKSWEERITNRLTQRLLRNIHGETGHRHHPEVNMPEPEYLILMEIEEIVDLTPRHLK
ncbi:MAG: pyridoxamine 5'-phosphate oxidase family protein [Candidatus Omnitrophota bacterium]